MTQTEEKSQLSACAMSRPTGWAEVTGPDRVTWLEGMVSNHVGRLAPGQGCYAAHLNPRGKVLGLLRVLVEPGRVLIAADQNMDRLVEEMDRLLIMEDAGVRSLGSELSTWTVSGPEARSRLANALGQHLEQVAKLYDHMTIGDVRIVHGKVGFDISVPSGEAEGFVSVLESAGIPLAGEAEWFRQSLEAGIPMYGTDVDDTTILSELGEEAIDYQKGCYIGQEVVAKIKYIGHVNRHFVGFRLDDVDLPEAHAERMPLTRDGKELGFLTRAVRSRRLGGFVALGYVRHPNHAPGSEFLVGEGPGTATPGRATIVPLPFTD